MGLLGGTGVAVIVAGSVMNSVHCYRRSAVGGQFTVDMYLFHAMDSRAFEAAVVSER